MEKILEQAFEEASKLSGKDQTAFAAFILEELKQERKWEELYKKSEKQLKTLANDALTEYREGKTKKLNPKDL